MARYRRSAGRSRPLLRRDQRAVVHAEGRAARREEGLRRDDEHLHACGASAGTGCRPGCPDWLRTKVRGRWLARRVAASPASRARTCIAPGARSRARRPPGSRTEPDPPVAAGESGTDPCPAEPEAALELRVAYEARNTGHDRRLPLSPRRRPRPDRSSAARPAGRAPRATCRNPRESPPARPSAARLRAPRRTAGRPGTRARSERQDLEPVRGADLPTADDGDRDCRPYGPAVSGSSPGQMLQPPGHPAA
jgi:hypothetical protein